MKPTSGLMPGVRCVAMQVAEGRVLGRFVVWVG